MGDFLWGTYPEPRDGGMGVLRQEAWARQVAGILTSRGIEIVRMVAAGLHNKEIADKLFICEGTVKNHLRHIFEKLQVSDRMDLTRFAEEKGLVG